MPPRDRLAPFDAWPVQKHDPRFGYMWFVPPATVVEHVVVEHGTLESATAMHEALEGLLAAERRSVEAAGGLVIIGDWRRLRSYTTEARRYFMRRMRERPRGLVRAAATVLHSVSPMLRMAVEAGGMILAVAGAAKVEVYDDVDEALQAHGVERPSALVRFPE